MPDINTIETNSGSGKVLPQRKSQKRRRQIVTKFGQSVVKIINDKQ